MPSNALARWTKDRLAGLRAIDAQCTQSFLVAPPPPVADENLRGFVMLLSAHFQGFCRDLHTECGQIIGSALPTQMQLMFQQQYQARRWLDGGNAKYDNIQQDFDRYGIDLTAALGVGKHGANAVNKTHLTQLERMNAWRNYAAHHNASTPNGGGAFTQPVVNGWMNSCDALATALDGIVYNQLLFLTNTRPW